VTEARENQQNDRNGELFDKLLLSFALILRGSSHLKIPPLTGKTDGREGCG
jgi:hypothetical protein